VESQIQKGIYHIYLEKQRKSFKGQNHYLGVTGTSFDMPKREMREGLSYGKQVSDPMGAFSKGRFMEKEEGG
jgi:hypothetical protein